MTLLVLVSALSVPAFVLASLSLNSTPVPREFNGWAAVFASGKRPAPRVFLTMTPSTPGGPGTHPVVEYGITVCGESDFDGVLVLAGGARLHSGDATFQPASRNRGSGSLTYLPNLAHLIIEDISSGGAADVAPTQVFRASLPSTPCHAEYNPTSPTWEGRTITIRGPLEGQTAHQSFAPFGLWPVREAQTWPYLGQVPVFDPSDHGAFRLGHRLPGPLFRPFQSYFGVDIGLLDGKASLEFARPEVKSGLEALAWAGSKPFAAKARITNTDNLNNWQTVSLVTGVWLGLGGSILATLALETVRHGRRRPSPPEPSALTERAKPSLPRRPRAGPPGHVYLGLAVATIMVIARRARRVGRRG